MAKRFGDSPAYFSAGKGSRARESTRGSRARFRSEYDRIFGVRKIKLMKKEDEEL